MLQDILKQKYNLTYCQNDKLCYSMIQVYEFGFLGK